MLVEWKGSTSQMLRAGNYDLRVVRALDVG